MDSIGGEGGCYVDNSMNGRENSIRTPPIFLGKGAYEIRIHYETATNNQLIVFLLRMQHIVSLAAGKDVP